MTEPINQELFDVVKACLRINKAWLRDAQERQDAAEIAAATIIVERCERAIKNADPLMLC